MSHWGRVGRSGAEMEGEQFRSEHRLSKGSKIRKGRAHFKKGRQPGMLGFFCVNVEGWHVMAG